MNRFEPDEFDPYAESQRIEFNDSVMFLQTKWGSLIIPNLSGALSTESRVVLPEISARHPDSLAVAVRVFSVKLTGTMPGLAWTPPSGHADPAATTTCRPEPGGWQR